MSKFANVMECLEIDKGKREKEVLPLGVKALDNDPEIFLIPVKPQEINNTCEKCSYCALNNHQGLVNELGIGGYQSNQKNPNEKTEYKPGEGVKLRVPHTKIIGKGLLWCCHNREMGKQGIFILNKNTPPCNEFKEKAKVK